MSEKTAKVFKSGNSQAIRLNKTVLNQLGLEIGDELTYEIRNGEIVFKKKDTSLKDEIQDFYRNGGRYKESAIDFGEPVGKEIW